MIRKISKNLDRRKFLKSISFGLIGTNFLFKKGPIIPFLPENKSRVVIGKAEKLLSAEGSEYIELVRKGVDQSIMALVGGLTPQESWNKIIKKDDVVGLKVTYERTRTDYQLIYAVANRLIDAGLPPENIILFERADYDLTLGNHKINRTNKGIKCFGIVKDEWHGATSESDKFNPQIYDIAGNKIQVCKIVADMCSVIINIPVIKSMSLSGFSTAMKNYFGCINSPVNLHGDNLSKHIAILNTIQPIKNKTKLIICDAIRNFGSSHVGTGSIIMSRDPVALDYTAKGILEKHLKKEISPKPSFIEIAAQLGVGVNDPEKIEWIEFDIT